MKKLVPHVILSIFPRHPEGTQSEAKRTRRIQAIITLVLCVLTGCVPGKYMLASPKVEIDPPPIYTVLPSAQKGDPLEGDQWNMAKIQAPEVWGSHPGSRAVQVMLLGTGINYNHPDLRANISINPGEMKTRELYADPSPNGIDDDHNGLVDDMVGWDFVENDGLAYDHLGFDTYAAGIIAAVHDNGTGMKGIAKHASLYPVRYIGSSGITEFPLIVAALQHVLRIKPKLVLLNIVNVLYHRNPNIQKLEKQMLKDVLTDIHRAQIPIVVGAGNLAKQITEDLALVMQLAQFPNVLVVSSTDAKDQKPTLANFHQQIVHTMAPGEDVLTTAPSGGWEKVSGTYIAAAHVAGALALAISLFDQQKDYRALFDALLSDAGSDEDAKFSSFCFGQNRLNIKKFLSVLGQ